MLEIAKKVTKTNKVVTLFKMWSNQTFVSANSVVDLFLEKIGCDCILYYHDEHYYDMSFERDDCKKETYAIFAQIWPGSMTGGGLWFCRVKDDGTFEYKMISKDSSFNKLLKWDLKKGIKDLWDNTVDVSTEEERLRFLDK